MIRLVNLDSIQYADDRLTGCRFKRQEAQSKTGCLVSTVLVRATGNRATCSCYADGLTREPEGFLVVPL